MENNKKIVEILNDLVEINNDRVAGYEKAIEETKSHDADLKGMFLNMANDSRNNVDELKNEIAKLGGEYSDHTSGAGKLHRAWMDVKTTFSGNDRQAILNSCEYGEDAAQKAYTDALQEDVDMSPQIRTIISEQQATLKTAHDVVKKYRDANHAIEA